METFTKAQVVERLAELNDFESTAAASRAMELVISTILEQVASGKEVTISGLGKFYPQLQAAKSGIVPSTGKPYSTPAKTVPKFKAAQAFKSALVGA